MLCPEGEVHVWTIDLTRTDPEEVLDATERERASRLVNAVDRQRFVAAHSAVRQILAGYGGLNPAELRILADENGKPYWPESHLRFNLTHSGERALLAVVEGRELGVDIELLRPLADVRALASRFLLPLDCQQLTKAPAADLNQVFLRLWVRREAFLKATGKGLKSLAQPFDPEHWTLLDLPAEPGYAAALVLEGTLSPQIRCKPYIRGDVTVLR